MSCIKYTFWVCVCSFIYPASNGHTPYYIVMRGLSDYTILLLYHTSPIPYFSYTILLLYHTSPIPYFSYTILLLYHTSPIPHFSYTTLLLYHTSPIPYFSYTILLLYHTSPIPYFSTWSPKRHGIWENIIEHTRKMCVLIFPTFWNISYSKKHWARCYREFT